MLLHLLYSLVSRFFFRWMVYIILPTLCFVISVLMYYFLSCSTAHLVSLSWSYSIWLGSYWQFLLNIIVTFSVLLTILCMTAAYTIDAAWRLAYVVTVPMSILYNESVDMVFPHPYHHQLTDQFIHFYPLYLIKRCVKKPQNGYNQINYFRNITVARVGGGGYFGLLKWQSLSGYCFFSLNTMLSKTLNSFPLSWWATSCTKLFLLLFSGICVSFVHCRFCSIRHQFSVPSSVSDHQWFGGNRRPWFKMKGRMTSIFSTF